MKIMFGHGSKVETIVSIMGEEQRVKAIVETIEGTKKMNIMQKFE
jgi:hypothetical protein